MNSTEAGIYLNWVRPLVFGCSILLAMVPVGCTPSSATSPLHIFVSGDTSGWITPCGCTSNQSGGMERRGTLLQSTANNKDRVYLDVGGAGTGSTPYQITRLRSILQGEGQLEIAAHNLGGAEVALNPHQIDELSQETSVVFVSANVVPNSGKSRVAKKVEFAKRGWKIAVTGIVSPKIAESSASNEWKITDPLQAIVRVFDQSDADLKIVLAYVSEPELRSLAKSLPEVHLVLGGPTGQMLTPQQVGPTVISSATNKGKFLAHFVVNQSKNESGSKGAVIEPQPFLEVASHLKKDPEQSAILSKMMELLGKMDVSATESGLQLDATRSQGKWTFAGSESCKTCHLQIFEQWSQTKHAHAWETLVSKGSQVDPACQLCHTTGYGGKGGFERIASSTNRTDVGCESCHGPSSEHNITPALKTPWAAKGKCQGCHDHENSPMFSLETYWLKIAHGRNTENTENDPNNR